ncbi:MAG: hypothetical protein ABFD69_01690 [Candidatus Sumerlaeia bacterium]
MREPMADTPRPRRRWPWIVLGILVAIPTVLVFALRVAVKLHPIRPEQLEPPQELVSFRPVIKAAAGKQPTKPLPNFEAYLVGSPNQSAVAIYAKYAGKYKYPSDWPGWPFLKWDFDDPLSAEQARFLIDSREIIDDLVKLAATGDAPVMTDEQAATLSTGELLRMPASNRFFLWRASVLLAAECRRLRDAVEFEAAADRLMAIHAIARLFSRPSDGNLMQSLSLQIDADRALAHWIAEGTIKPVLAEKIRKRLAAAALDERDYLNFVEIAYCNGRNELIQALNGPFGNLMTYSITPELIKMTEEPFETQDGFFRQYLLGLGMLAKGANRAYLMKANASGKIEQYDAQFKAILPSLDMSRPVPPNSHNRLFGPFDESLVRRRMQYNAALLRANLTGLDLISGRKTHEIDPFQNKPITVVENTTSTLIYSIGPDRVDQGAAISYDPSNGTFSAGDIFVRVPRK